MIEAYAGSIAPGMVFDYEPGRKDRYERLTIDKMQGPHIWAWCRSGLTFTTKRISESRWCLLPPSRFPRLRPNRCRSMDVTKVRSNPACGSTSSPVRSIGTNGFSSNESTVSTFGAAAGRDRPTIRSRSSAITWSRRNRAHRQRRAKRRRLSFVYGRAV